MKRCLVHDERGLTLVETLIAFVILVVALIPMMNMFYTSLAGYTSAAEDTIALNLAQEQLEALLATPYENIHDLRPEPYPGFQQFAYQVEVAIYDADREIKKVTVHVYPQDGSGAGVRLVTLIAKR